MKEKQFYTEEERTSHWLQGEYVEDIFEKVNQKYQRLPGYNKPLMRHE